MKKTLALLTIGVLIGSALSPLAAFAARTAAPVLTGLFPSASVSINLPAPSSASLGNATTTGSVYSNGGAALYFSVTALDGVGESLGSTLLGTSTVNQAHGWQITWAPVPGAFSYRVYFSTSTPQAMLQYFTATSTASAPNAFYTFTSTSSPTFVSAFPTANSAYVVNLLANGNSWLNGGAFAIGTSTFAANVLLNVAATSTATSTAEVGAKGASGGRLIIVDSSGSHTTCTEISTAGGTVAGKVVTCP